MKFDTMPIKRYLEDSAKLLKAAAKLHFEIGVVAERIVQRLRTHRRVYIFGNGGSAADAQHFAAEFTGKFERQRNPYPVIALTTDTSALTAIGNDYGYEEVFARQVQALVNPFDLVIGISTSGKSANVLKALKVAFYRPCYTVLLTGGHPREEAKEYIDSIIRVPSTRTCLIQQAHGAILHAICAYTDLHL